MNVVGRAFSHGLELKKLVYDLSSGAPSLATTWHTGATGTHGGDAGYILSAVSQDMDRFLVAFLRVNETACG